MNSNGEHKVKRSARIVSEQLEIKKKEKNQRYGHLISRDDKVAFYKSSPTGRCTTKTAIEGNELVLNKLMAFDQLYFRDLLKQLNSLMVYVDHHRGLPNVFLETLDNAYQLNPRGQLADEIYWALTLLTRRPQTCRV